MKKSFVSSSNCLEKSINDDFSITRSPHLLKNIDCLNCIQKEIFTEKNNQFNSYGHGNKEERFLFCVDTKNNSKDHSLKDNKNNSNNIVVLDEPKIENKVSSEMCENTIDSYSSNKKLEKSTNEQKSLEMGYIKKFQLFNKSKNNPYVNEVINSINDSKTKEPKKLFNIDNFKNGVKLVGRKRSNKIKKRCEKPDDIRKKLKSRFHKIFTKKLNDNLKEINSEKKFYLMPQIFICNIAKKQNKEAMNMKIKDLFRKNFIDDYKEYKLKNIKSNNNKYLKNLKTLEYLEKNIDIQQKSKFNIIGEMKYFEILEEFFYSEEFEDTVISESKKKSLEYVKDYVNKARTYVKFFLYSD